MFGAPKAWFGSRSLWKPKNIHSLDYLKYLYTVLSKNAVVTEHNQQLLIEVWRLISEILIWGDQNDNKVFDFFLEKNMLTFYIAYIRQPSARFIIVQLLQTLNILFENTAQETSIYFLLSNNHVNDIITSQFDFADEEVMAYYISFLKTLSLKLNPHTIHFFFNEHTRNFPLLTEALKFDSHPESMVRIAARTITLNVFRVRNRAVIRFVCDRVAPAQFSNFAYNISRQAVAMDSCLSQAQALQVHQQQQKGSVALPTTGQQSISSLTRTRERLQDYSAEHLDLLHYVADVLQLDIEELNALVCPILLSRLLLPVYLPSLLPSISSTDVEHLVENMPRISPLLSLYLLSHFFQVFKGHAPLVSKVLNMIVSGDSVTNVNILRRLGRVCTKVPISIADALRGNSEEHDDPNTAESQQSQMPKTDSSLDMSATNDIFTAIKNNQTDDEKLSEFTQSFTGRVYLNAIMQLLDSFSASSTENVACDRECLFALTLLLSIVNNTALSRELLNSLGLNSKSAPVKQEYNHFLIDKLITLLTCAAKIDSKIRPVTVVLASELLMSQVLEQTPTPGGTVDSLFSHSSPSTVPVRASCLSDLDLARIESAREESTLMLRSFFKSEDSFVDAFEDEYNHFHDKRRRNIERILDDANLLLSPGASTPLSGVNFAHRLPCGEAERARVAMLVYFTLRALSLQLQGETETQLPLLKLENLVSQGNALDLNNSDLLACAVTVSNEKTERLFLVLERDQLILVRPDALRMGWGIVRLAGPLHDVELTIDKEDGRGLHVTLHPIIVSTSFSQRPLSREVSSVSSTGSLGAQVVYSRSIVSARFQFDDHIRCRAARERIVRGRQRIRLSKLQRVAALLEIPPEATNYVGGGVCSHSNNTNNNTGNQPSVSALTANHAVLSMFNPKVQQAIMAASASTPPSARVSFLPPSVSTPLMQTDSASNFSVDGKPSTSTDEEAADKSANVDQLTPKNVETVQRQRSAAISEAPTGISKSPSACDVPDVLDADQHRRRFVQNLGVTSTPLSSSMGSLVTHGEGPPVPPRQHEIKSFPNSPQKASSQSNEWTTNKKASPMLIDFADSTSTAKEKADVAAERAYSSAPQSVSMERDLSDDTLRKEIETLVGAFDEDKGAEGDIKPIVSSAASSGSASTTTSTTDVSGGEQASEKEPEKTGLEI